MMNASLNHRRVEVTPEVTSFGAAKPPSKRFSISKSVEYVLCEQRFLFVLIGVAITSLFFFFLQAPSNVDSSPAFPALEVYNVDEARVFEKAPYKVEHVMAARMGTGKIPLGLQRKALRIVVTGGAGFVGSHLVDRLMERGDSVIVVDNFFTGRKENVQHHFGNPRFELIRHDVVEPLLLEVDQIYHLACPASPVHYKFNPIKTIISCFMFD